MPGRGVGHRGSRRSPDGRHDALAESLPSWPPFAGGAGGARRAAERGWRLAILSNTDPDLLAASVAAIGVPFDALITAGEAGSYKPAPGHWERFFAETGAARDRHVHVAASLFHDIEPAARMGLRGGVDQPPRRVERPPPGGRAARISADCRGVLDELGLSG